MNTEEKLKFERMRRKSRREAEEIQRKLSEKAAYREARNGLQRARFIVSTIAIVSILSLLLLALL